MKISKNGIELIKEFEGFSSTIYSCSAGQKTIGFGHVLTEKDSFTQVTEKEAENLLIEDSAIAEDVINKNVLVSLTQNQFDALVSLVYNIGGSNFTKSKGLKLLNDSQYSLAAIEFFDEKLGFTKVGENTLQGLVKRRNQEWSLWNKSNEI